MGETAGRERPSRWATSEIVLWLAVFGMFLWLVPQLPALGVILAIFSGHRVAGALTLFKAGDIRARGGSGIQVLAGWLYFTRTAVWGLLLASIGVTAVVTHPDQAGVVIGALLIFVSSPFLILGVQLAYRWHDALHEEQAPPPK
jgi:hypothetical protein